MPITLMTLATYRAKRNFEQTAEPKGQKAAGAGPLRFVVQKHHASRLHYDFRLELDGTLKSWAVPKGPSLNPDDKRLAIMVEDHPLGYASFEGVIPSGNYGAGTVMVWDTGPYHARQTNDPTKGEQLLREGLASGHLTFILQGKKLQGEFALIKFKRGRGNEWLLVKKADAFAVPETRGADLDRSVLSGRTMEEIASGEPSRKPKGGKPQPQASPTASGLTPHVSGPRPQNVKPMLATPVARPFDHPHWLFEVKWDGYRAIAEVAGAKVRLYSRRHLSFEQRYVPIVESLTKLRHEAVIDGEVVVLDDAGAPIFQLLQSYLQTRTGNLVYIVFDLLYLDGQDLRDVPLVRRKELLARIVTGLPRIQYSDHVAEHGVAFFEAAAKRGLEGIMAKERNSLYREGRRSTSWLKIKARSRQDVVIAGFTEPKRSRKHFGSLILGVYEGSEFVYVGHSGSGFTDKSLADVHALLEPLLRTSCPFAQRPVTNAPPHWVEPKLVCEVEFASWTKDGHMREPIFIGLREDVPPKNVHREIAVPPERVLSGERKVRKEDGSRVESRSSVLHLPSTPHSALPTRLSLSGRTVNLTNLQKVYWPEAGYTKGDLITYYREVAPVIVPHLKDRPQSLHRHPNGISGKSFFQKDVSGQPPPDWVTTVAVDPDDPAKRAILCQDDATLVYLANLGCIELNPWNSRFDTADNPDYAVIDLDPQEIAFAQVVETAQAFRKILDRVGAVSVCKTSGKRGLHVYVPLGTRYTHDQARQFAEVIAHWVHRTLPNITSLERLPARRRQRVYLDCLQNGKGKTLAAVYSARPVPEAMVSTPLKWTELKPGLDPTRFTIRTLMKRLDKVGDLWTPILSTGIDVADCLQRLTKLVGKGSSRGASAKV